MSIRIITDNGMDEEWRIDDEAQAPTTSHQLFTLAMVDRTKYVALTGIELGIVFDETYGLPCLVDAGEDSEPVLDAPLFLVGEQARFVMANAHHLFDRERQQARIEEAAGEES